MPVAKTIKRNITIAVLLGNLLLAAITIIAAYGGKVDPETSTIPAILAMTFPGWLLLTVLTLVTDLIMFRRMAVIPFLTLIVCLTPILSFSPLNFSKVKLTPQQEKNTFTLMSYNVYGLIDFKDPSYLGKSRKELQEETLSGILNPTLSYIINKAPDVACLQEFPNAIPNPMNHISVQQMDSIYTIFPHRTGVYGENVYSRFPLYPIDLRQPESEYCWFGAAMVHIMGHKTLVVSVHFQSIGLNSDDKALFHQLTEGEGARKVKEVKQQLLGKLSLAFKERAKQARLLREQIDSLNVENVIIAGDFNDIPDCYAMRLLAKEDFKSAFATAGCGPTHTYYGNRFFFNIDHILYRGKMHAVGYERQKEGNSDHYPIEVKFIWKD